MDKTERLTNAYLIVLLPLATAAAAWAAIGLRIEQISIGLAALAVVTVFFSSHFRIQLPRTKIHLTISDAMIMLSLLIYGGEVAVLLSILETAYTSFSFRRKGVPIKPKTALLNISIGAISVFITTHIVRSIFGSAAAITENGSAATYFWLLVVMSVSLFLVNSLVVSAVVAARSEKSVLSVWNDYCFNALVMYLSGAALAGFAAKAFYEINVLSFAAVAGFFALIYLTYRRYVDDIKRTAAKAEQAERERAEQAEKHLDELKHYVSQLETTGRELEQSREEFRHAAFHDALTGLPNRNYFIDAITQLLRRAREDNKFRFAVLFLDLNRFRTINDSLGHSTGDRLIKQVAERLRGMVGQDDVVGRFSGDKFAIILTSVESPDVSTKFAEQVAERVGEAFSFEGKHIYTSASVGIALSSPEYESAQDILRDADIAMYHAKDNDADWVIFDEVMRARAVSRLQLETDLRYAIEHGQLELYYQPIVALDTLLPAGFEALVRWNHPTKGMISPGAFIPISEDTGLIIPMTLQILRRACEQLREWHLRSPENCSLMMSVNLSGKHFAQPDLVDQISSVIEETGIDASRLKLEITESAVMENADNAISVLNRIRDIGVQLSVDDFGTGYSSLSYLHSFPINTLKVDRSFVEKMETGNENAKIVSTVIALAHTLNLNVIAEGIESVEQLYQLRELGCEYGQGYLFSRPVPASAVEELFNDRGRWRDMFDAAAVGSRGIRVDRYIVESGVPN